LSFEWKRAGVMDSDNGDDGQMRLVDWDEKSKKKKDQDEVDGMRQEVYSKGNEMRNEMSDHRFLQRKTKVVERW